jgi:hypothetical protein
MALCGMMVVTKNIANTEKVGFCFTIVQSSYANILNQVYLHFALT